MIRAGLVGAGLHALVHAEGYQSASGVTLNAVCDAVDGRAKAMADQFNIPHVCKDMAEMIDRGLVDLVDIITPPLTHLDIVRQAVDSKSVHIICEKPLALDVGEAQQMCDLGAGSAFRTHTSFQRRFDPVLIHLRNMLADGYIGEFVLSNTSVIVNWGVLKHESQALGFRQWLDSTATGGGFISGALPHYIDLVRYLVGNMTHLVAHSGTASTYADGEVDEDGPDDTVIVAGAIEGGGMFNISATWAAGNPTQESWEIVGSKRTLQVRPDGRLLTTTDSGSLEEVVVPPALMVERPGMSNGGFGFGNAAPGFGSLVSDVAQSISNGGKTLCATFEDGLRSAQVISRLNAINRKDARL